MPKGAGLDDMRDVHRSFAFLAPYPMPRIFPFDTALYHDHPGVPGSSWMLSRLSHARVPPPGVDHGRRGRRRGLPVGHLRTAALGRPPRATRPDQRWHRDVLYLWVFGRWYFLVTVIDAYSRYVVAWDLCWQLTDDAMALVLHTALDRTPGAAPEIVTDNAPEFIGRDFLLACKAESLKHIRTWIYHPQSNGTLERYHRTFREESWSGAAPADYPAALPAA